MNLDDKACASAQQKISTAMMLLEMYSLAGDAKSDAYVRAAHSYIQSALFDVKGGETRIAPSDDAMTLTSTIFAEVAIESAAYKGIK